MGVPLLPGGPAATTPWAHGAPLPAAATPSVTDWYRCVTSDTWDLGPTLPVPGSPRTDGAGMARDDGIHRLAPRVTALVRRAVHAGAGRGVPAARRRPARPRRGRVD